VDDLAGDSIGRAVLGLLENVSEWFDATHLVIDMSDGLERALRWHPSASVAD
jgi:hypothetical protein